MILKVELMKIAVIDGLGGGFGSQIINRIKAEFADKLDIIALGTNAIATSKMLQSGANSGATGENALILNIKYVDLIVGPVGLIIPNSMKGEITTVMAEAITSCDAKKIIIGMKQPHVKLVGLSKKSLNELIEDLLVEIRSFVKNQNN